MNKNDIKKLFFKIDTINLFMCKDFINFMSFNQYINYDIMLSILFGNQNYEYILDVLECYIE